MQPDIDAAIESFYIGYRLSHTEDKSWANLHTSLCSAFPQYTFQLLMSRRSLIIKCGTDEGNVYFKCSYEDPTYISSLGEEEILRDAIY